MNNRQSALPSRETVIEVAWSAIYGRELESVKELVSWMDRKKVERALKSSEPTREEHPKVASYLEKVFTNSAKVSQSEDGSRQIRLIPVNRGVGMAISYYGLSHLRPLHSQPDGESRLSIREALQRSDKKKGQPK